MEPHEVLGVSSDADDAEIRAAYRALVRRHHPDRHVGEPPEVQRAEADRMAEVTSAFHLLNDPAALARYQANQARVGRAPGAVDRHPGEHVDEGTWDYRRAAAAEFDDVPGQGRWGRTPPPPPRRAAPSRGGRRGRTASSRPEPGTRRRSRGARFLNAVAWLLLAGLVAAVWVLGTDAGQRTWDSVRSTVSSAPPTDPHAPAVAVPVGLDVAETVVQSG